jgi:hypothetical protein
MPPPFKEKFPCPFLELAIYGSKYLYLATVKLCTSCSQTADRKALSLKLEMKFLSCWGIKKKDFLIGLNGLYLSMQLTD